MECVNKCPAKALQYKANDNIEIQGITTIMRSSLDNIKCRLAHISGGLSPYAPEELNQYVKNIIDGTDTHMADGSTRPTPEELEEKVTPMVSYASNVKKLFGCPSALCGDGCIRACLSHLDEAGRLSLTFRKPFKR